MYTPNDFTQVDPLTFLREHPAMFFRSGGFTAPEMVGKIVIEAIVQGGQGVEVNRDGDWYLISADIDWLAHLERDPFNEVIPHPEDGPNSMFVEVLLTVFVADVFTAASGELRKIKGESPLPNYDQLGTAARIVGFRSST